MDTDVQKSRPSWKTVWRASWKRRVLLGENLVMPLCLSSAMDRMILHVRQEKPLVSKIMSDLSDTLAIVWVCCSVARLCPALCHLMDWSTPGFPAPHRLLEFAQVHVHWIGDAIQPSQSLSLSSPSAWNLSQHQGLFQCQLFASGGQSMGASASPSLPKSIQGWFPLRLTCLISLLSEGLLRVFSSSMVQKDQFFGALPSLLSSCHIRTWLLERP